MGCLRFKILFSKVMNLLKFYLCPIYCHLLLRIFIERMALEAFAKCWSKLRIWARFHFCDQAGAGFYFILEIFPIIVYFAYLEEELLRLFNPLIKFKAINLNYFFISAIIKLSQSELATFTNYSTVDITTQSNLKVELTNLHLYFLYLPP